MHGKIDYNRLDPKRLGLPVTVLLAAASLALPSTAWGDEPGHDTYLSEQRVSDQVLSSQRGGFRFGGVDFDFGVIVTVLSDGLEVARTTIAAGPDGSFTRNLTISGAGVSEFDGTNAGEQGVDISALSRLEGVVLHDDQGATFALSGVAPGLLSSAVVNHAANRNVHQNVDATITINNFSHVQSNLLNAAQLSTVKAALTGTAMLDPF